MKKNIIVTLTLCAMCLAASAQTQVAKDLYAKATANNANIEKVIKNEASEVDSTSCHDLAVMFYQANDYTHAAACWDLARQKVVKFGKNYEKMLNFMALCYNETGDQKGIAHVMALMEEHNQHELTLPCDEPECLTDRAEYYATSGDKAKAKDHYLRAMQKTMTDAQKARIYESFATFQTQEREFASASEYFQLAANAKQVLEGKTESYIQLVYKTAVYGYLGKEYERSIDYYQQVIGYYEKHDSDAARKNIAQCHKGIGNSYSAMNDYGAARDQYKLVMLYYEQYDQTNEEYPKAIARVATAEKFNKEYDASIEHYKLAIAIFRERGMTEEALDTQNSLKLCYAYAGKPIEGDEDLEIAAREARNKKLDALIKEETENLDLIKKYLGKLQYADALATIAGCYHTKEDYRQSVAYYKQYIQAVREAIRDEFRMQSEAERMTAWQNEKQSVQDIMYMLATLPVGQEALMADLSALAYDCMLLSKGILLNSSIEFEKIVNASNDANLKAAYAETKRINAELLKLRQTVSSDEDMENIVKLQRKSQQLQLELNRGCAELADFTNYIGYDWKDVQAKLRKEDVAIEFAAISTGTFDEDSFMGAIILTKDMKQPVAVPTCTFAQLKMMQKDSLIYSTPVVGNLVWGNLSQYIKDKKRIYFSADGAFNQIGIEYLQWEGKPISEQKDMVRLSSTKELCYSTAKAKVEHAAIFGDINYTEEGNYSADAKRSVATMRGSAQVAGDDDIQFGDLGGTRKEMAEIGKTLHAAGVKNVQTFGDTKASEQAFIDLSDSKVNLLHIATHGAYLAKEKDTEAESMQQSILAFAGANLGNFDTGDDGYVTAADVAKMNLRDCNLAVLSACETALGKMGDDGVFGLQRGFKNAGVHTLLMSLRKVNDQATTELMTQFYKELMAGSSPNESLRKAQIYLRQHEYDDPEYWASFIVLDGKE